MKDNRWIKGAIILGLSFFIAVLLVKPIGVSTQFSVLTGMIHEAIDPDIIQEDPDRESGYSSSNAYYDKSDGKLAKSIKNPINYSFIFVLAIPVGSYIGYRLNKNKDNEVEVTEVKVNKIEQSSCNINERKTIRPYVISFIGGFLLLYGARFAGGCTSGHMMSGMMQTSISGYVFALVVFAVSIPTAIIIKKIRQ